MRARNLPRERRICAGKVSGGCRRAGVLFPPLRLSTRRCTRANRALDKGDQQDDLAPSFQAKQSEEPPAEQGVPMEWTTRFEPATLTLARWDDLFRRPVQTPGNWLWPAVLIDQRVVSFRGVFQCLAVCALPAEIGWVKPFRHLDEGLGTCATGN